MGCSASDLDLALKNKAIGNDFKTSYIETLAGSTGGVGVLNGVGTTARFRSPQGTASDGTSLFVADTFNHTVRKIDIATGAVSTLAGIAGTSGNADGLAATALFNTPQDAAVDGTDLYITEWSGGNLRKIDLSTGMVSTVATGLNFPKGVEIVGSDIFITSDGAGTIIKLDRVTLAMTTFAGPFNGPTDLTSDGTSLYVTDTFAQVIRKIDIGTAAVTVLAGTLGSSGYSDGFGGAAKFYYPSGISNDGTYLYVGDGANSVIRKVAIATGEVTTVAGSVNQWGASDGIGPAAKLYWPASPTLVAGLLYFPDDNAIRTLNISTNEVLTVYGKNQVFGYVDGTGSSAAFGGLTEIVSDGTYLFVADNGNNVIRKVEIATGLVTTLAGDPNNSGYADGIGSAALFDGPQGLATDGTNLYVSEPNNQLIRKIVIATGEVTTLAGDPGNSGSSNGLGSAAKFNSPYGLACNGTDLFVSDFSNSTVRKINLATGMVSTLAGSVGVFGFANGIGSAAQFSNIENISANNSFVFVTDQGNQLIRKIDIATGEVTTLAGDVGVYGDSNGIGSAANFYNPGAMTTDGTYVYVADGNDNNIIRKIEIATGNTTTTFKSQFYQTSDGPLSDATAGRLRGIFYKDGKLFFTQEGSVRVLSL